MQENKIGILTFHCSNNYGAMLQAYGLKKYLRLKGLNVSIVPYEPPYMTGRHWLFPYVPHKSLFCQSGWRGGWKARIGIGTDFFRQKENMLKFRKKYLTEDASKKIFFLCQMKSLSYHYYIVGSDQIWNPEITCGLKKAYFGAFNNKKKKKVIAYAASLGKASLSFEYEEQFKNLLSHLDAVSLREKKAIPYVKKFFQGEVIDVIDPVFLLKREEWQKLEKFPQLEAYILVYVTENNQELYEYAKYLSQSRKLPVVELRTSKGEEHAGWHTDYIAGPSEFLGYVHNANYIITNSFHAIAFSIIFRKKFLAFLHSTLGTRIENILDICGLENRIYHKEKDNHIDFEPDWEIIDIKIKEYIKLSEDFLERNII